MTAVRRLLTLIPLSLMATALLAQQPQSTTTSEVPRATEPVTADTDKDLNNPRAMRISLDDALKTSMERNLGVTLQRYDYRMSGQSLLSQYGLFDWFSTADVAHSSNQSPAVSTFQASGSRSTVANFGLSQVVPTGGSYTFTFDNSRSVTSGGGTIVNPSYRSSLGVQASQPLLRNFGLDVTRRGINIARNTLGINQELFRSVLINTAVSVEQAYLDLIYARQNVDVVKEALFLARDQARITQIRIDVGASAPLDILQPRVQIATSEELLIAAVASVRDAEDRLRALMNLAPAEWDRPLVPTEDVHYTPVDVTTEAAVAKAFELRPELKESQLTIDSRRIQYLYAKNQTLPKLDLNVGYGAAGLAGRALDFDPVTGVPTGTTTTTGYDRALRQVVKSDFPSWNIGVSVGIPVLNIGARAEAKRAELDWRRSRTDLEQTKQSVAIDVRKAVRDVDTAAKEITATKTGREAAERNLDAERKRYENGMTTNFQVLQIQQQLSDSRVRELQALVGYNKAVSNYHRAVGDLLDVHNITVDEPARPNEPSFFSEFDRYNWLNYGSRVNLEEKKDDDK